MINGDTVKTKILEKDSVNVPYKDTTVQEQRLKIQEFLPNGHQHTIYKFERAGTSSEVADQDQVIVPKDSIWVMGDHRGYSRDSRYFGPIPVSGIIGRVEYIYWGENAGKEL